MASRILKRAAIAAVTLVLLLGAAAIYLLNADLGWTRGPLVRAASKAIGRQLAIAGPYHLHLGKTVRMSASGITLANASWAKEPNLLSVDHLDVEVETLSLLRGPVQILRLAATGVVLDLERNARGAGSWETAGRKPSSSRASSPQLPVVHDLELGRVRAAYRAADRPVPLVLELPAGHLTEKPDGIVDLALRGKLDGTPLQLTGHLGPIGQIVRSEPFKQDLSFRLGAVEGRLQGRTASLSTLAGSSLDLFLHGPDLSKPLALLGISGLPGGAFRIEASTRPAGAALDARIEMTTPLAMAGATGRIVPGQPPKLDLRITASGKNLSAAGVLAGLHDLPARPFTLETRLRSRGFPLHFEGLKIHAAGADLAAHGTLGRPPGLEGTDATVKIRAPSPSLIARLLGVHLPRGKLSASARVTLRGDTLEIHALDAQIGANRLHADGTLGKGTRERGASFAIDFSGPDLLAFDELAGTPLPPGPFRAAGKITSTGNGIGLDSLTVRLGGNRLEVSGTITARPDRSGSKLMLSLEGRDPTSLASLAGIHGLPASPYRGAAQLLVEPNSLEIRQIELSLGDNDATGTIRLARPPAAGPIQLQLTVRGKNLDELGPLLRLRGLPPHAYRASGRLEITPTDYGFKAVELQVGKMAASADGRLGRPPEFNGTRLTIHASGPRLAELAAVTNLPKLPDLPFDINSDLHIGPGAIELQEIEGTLGRSHLSVHGGFQPKGLPIHLALDVAVRGDDPADLTRVLEGLGLGTMPSLPSRPYTVQGQIEHDPTGSRFTKLECSLGDLTGSIDGFLGEPPEFHGTELDIQLSGGNGANIEELVGLHPKVEGLRFRCSIRRLEQAQHGAGALLGIEGALAADRLAIGKKKTAGATGASPPPHGIESSSEASTAKAGGYVFSETPFHLRLPAILRGKLDCRFGRLLLAATPLRNVHLMIVFKPNSLSFDPVRATVGDRGTVSGALSLASKNHRVSFSTDLQIADANGALFLGGEQGQDAPRLNSHMELEAGGVSLHQLASNADGRFYLSLTSGKVQSSILDSLGDSIFLSIIDALNPFRKKEKMTELECAVIAGTVKKGGVTLDPVGLKTASVTTVARGTIDLATEKLSLDFASMARRGLGFSASTLTNQYIKIGGTLRKPSVQLKPVSAAAKTGLAVVTGGISLLAEGLWNRVSSESDICSGMADQIHEMWQQPAAAPPEPPPNP